MRLWESIRKYSHWERIHEDLQGITRICETLGEDSQGLDRL